MAAYYAIQQDPKSPYASLLRVDVGEHTPKPHWVVLTEAEYLKLSTAPRPTVIVDGKARVSDPPPPKGRFVPLAAFLDRFTFAELAALEGLDEGRALLRWASARTHVDLDAPQLVDALLKLSDRAHEILA